MPNRCSIYDIDLLANAVGRPQAFQLLARPDYEFYRVGENSIILLKHLTPYLYEAHIHFNNNDFRKVLKDGLELKDYIFKTTECIKVLFMIPIDKKSIIKFCKCAGASYEGRLNKSFKNSNGCILDQVIYTLTKEI